MVTISRAAFIPLCVITLTAGTAFIMWLGEQITERGIGNGMSLLIFAGIVVGLPKGIENLYEKARDSAWGALTPLAIIILIVGMIAVVAFIVFVERSERRIPVQYAKRIVGRRLMGGQSTHLPLKVNSGGVMPVIFASSILSAPLLFAGSGFVRNSGFLTRITLVGALYLIVISLIPQILISGIHLNDLWLVGGFFEKLPTWVTH